MNEKKIEIAADKKVEITADELCEAIARAIDKVSLTEIDAHMFMMFGAAVCCEVFNGEEEEEDDYQARHAKFC